MNQYLFRLLHPNLRMRSALLGILLLGLLAFFILGTRSFATSFVPPAPWDKLAHMVVFGGIAGFIWIISGARHAWLAVLLALALGCLDETLQSFTPGRDADWHDIVADVMGACTVVMALQMLQWRARMHVEPLSAQSALRGQSAA